jgi:hypothetical protein
MAVGGGRPVGGAPGGGWGCGASLGLGIAVGAGPALGPPEPACGRPLTPTLLFWPFAMGRE